MVQYRKNNMSRLINDIIVDAPNIWFLLLFVCRKEIFVFIYLQGKCQGMVILLSSVIALQ